MTDVDLISSLKSSATIAFEDDRAPLGYLLREAAVRITDMRAHIDSLVAASDNQANRLEALAAERKDRPSEAEAIGETELDNRSVRRLRSIANRMESSGFLKWGGVTPDDVRTAATRLEYLAAQSRAPTSDLLAARLDAAAQWLIEHQAYATAILCQEARNYLRGKS